MRVSLVYNDSMEKTTRNAESSKNGRRAKTSKLGRHLRRISDQFFTAGGKPLSRQEIAREVAERRGAR